MGKRSSGRRFRRAPRMETLNILAVWRWVYYSELNARKYYNTIAIANAIASAIEYHNGSYNGTANSI